MNMQQILNDPELSKELDKAYALAAPYRAKVQYKLHLLQQCQFTEQIVYFHPTSDITAIVIIADKTAPYIHSMLKV